MILMEANTLLGPLEGVSPKILTFLGLNGTRMACCHFMAHKKSLFLGPTPSNGPRNGYCPHQNHYVLHHINDRHINSYFQSHPRFKAEDFDHWITLLTVAGCLVNVTACRYIYITDVRRSQLTFQKLTLIMMPMASDAKITHWRVPADGYFPFNIPKHPYRA